MGDTGRRVIGVTGAPGAWLNQVAKHLEGMDCAVLWPDQYFTNAEAERLYNNNTENPEVYRINRGVLSACGMSAFGCELPKFYGTPFPGPQEVVNKFPPSQNVLIVDSALCLLWSLWQPHLTDLIVVDVDSEVTTNFIQRWIDGNMSGSECVQLHSFYYECLDGVIPSANSCYRIDNSSVVPCSSGEESWVFHQVGLDDILEGLLNSGIEATDG